MSVVIISLVLLLGAPPVPTPLSCADFNMTAVYPINDMPEPELFEYQWTLYHGNCWDSVPDKCGLVCRGVAIMLGGEPHIATSNHCFDHNDRLYFVRGWGDQEFHPVLHELGSDRSDMAFLRFIGKTMHIPTVPIAKKIPEVNDRVRMIIMKPHIFEIVYEYVDAQLCLVNHHGWGMPSYELSYPVRKGSSGSGVFNDKNELIGILWGTTFFRSYTTRWFELFAWTYAGGILVNTLDSLSGS